MHFEEHLKTISRFDLSKFEVIEEKAEKICLEFAVVPLKGVVFLGSASSVSFQTRCLFEGKTKGEIHQEVYWRDIEERNKFQNFQVMVVCLRFVNILSIEK